MSHFPPYPGTYDELIFSGPPTSWSAGTSIQVSFDNPWHCFEGYVVPTVDVAARSIVIRVGPSDTLQVPCPAQFVTPKSFSIPPLPRGQYQLEMIMCPPLPVPGTPECYLFASRSVLVGGGEPMPVPALSPLAAALAAVLLLALATRQR